MPPTRFAGIAAAVVAVGAAFAPAAVSAAGRDAPSCAAIAFRPVPSGLTDGEQDAGLYKSHFGRIEVKASVKDGVAQRYYIEMDDKPLTAVSAANLPQNVAGCAKVKRLAAPGKPEGPCTGDRLTVLIAHNGGKRYMLLYAHRGGTWRFCSAGAV